MTTLPEGILLIFKKNRNSIGHVRNSYPKLKNKFVEFIKKILFSKYCFEKTGDAAMPTCPRQFDANHIRIRGHPASLSDNRRCIQSRIRRCAYISFSIFPQEKLVCLSLITDSLLHREHACAGHGTGTFRKCASE